MSTPFSFSLRAVSGESREGERERARLFCGVDGRVDRALDEHSAGDHADEERERLCAMVSAQQGCVRSSYAQI
jgi:hypothetical protein